MLDSNAEVLQGLSDDWRTSLAAAQRDREALVEQWPEPAVVDEPQAPASEPPTEELAVVTEDTEVSEGEPEAKPPRPQRRSAAHK